MRRPSGAGGRACGAKGSATSSCAERRGCSPTPVGSSTSSRGSPAGREVRSLLAREAVPIDFVHVVELVHAFVVEHRLHRGLYEFRIGVLALFGRFDHVARVRCVLELLVRVLPRKVL